MKTASPHLRAAFSLVEVALALGVAAFCLVPVIGLLPIGVNSNRTSFEQTGAANVASAVITDLRAVTLVTPPANQNTPSYQILIPGVPQGNSTFVTMFVRADGTLSGTINTSADAAQSPHYRVTISFASVGVVKSSAVVGNPNARTARVLITWPAMADPDYTKAPGKYSGSFETFTGLIGN